MFKKRQKNQLKRTHEELIEVETGADADKEQDKLTNLEPAKKRRKMLIGGETEASTADLLAEEMKQVKENEERPLNVDGRHIQESIDDD